LRRSRTHRQSDDEVVDVRAAAGDSAVVQDDKPLVGKRVETRAECFFAEGALAP
jgi:hypothetical protein